MAIRTSVADAFTNQLLDFLSDLCRIAISNLTCMAMEVNAETTGTNIKRRMSEVRTVAQEDITLTFQGGRVEGGQKRQGRWK